MSTHQEKQRIFDAYAKSQEFDDWNDLIIAFEVKAINSDEFENHLFAACDLVQEEQQKRISENACIEFSQEDQCFSIDKYSIINPENKIQ